MNRGSDRTRVPDHPPALGTPPLPRVPDPERWELDSGLRVVVVPQLGLPQVALRLVMPAGSAADPRACPGLASMVAGLLTEGTRTYTADAFNTRLDSLGAEVSVRTSHDFVEVDAVLLSETLAEVLPLVGELVRCPVFPERETERVRAETLDALQARRDEPANVADDHVAEALFGDHPYARLSMGTREGIERITRTALADFHTSHYRPDGSYIIVAGDFSPADLRIILNEAFSGWVGTAPAIAYPAPPPAARSAGRRLDVPWNGAAQAEIRIASLGIERRSAHWVTAGVANYILGGSTITGRLGANLREDKGWTYGARSGLSPAVQPGGWVAETAVDVEVADAAVDEMIREIRRMCEEEVVEHELQRAKDALILSLPRAFETPGRIVGRFATIEAFGLAADYWRTLPDRVRSVTAESVYRVSHMLFNPDRLVRVVVGNGGE